MNREHQIVMVLSTVLGSWPGKELVHEFGHVLGAWITGGVVARVVFHPLTISRTDLTHNPNPLIVVWAGPVFGVTAPLLLWAISAMVRLPCAFLLRFFLGFCLLVNGLYIGIGSFDGVGDCGEMLRHGSQPWQLWLFGLVTAPFGFWLWHGQGQYFGIGSAKRRVTRTMAYGTLAVFVLLLIFGFVVGGE